MKLPLTIEWYSLNNGLTIIEEVVSIMFKQSRPKRFELESNGVLIRYFG